MKLLVILFLCLMQVNAWSADGGSCISFFSGIRNDLTQQFFNRTETFLPSELSTKQDKKIGRIFSKMEKGEPITELEIQNFVSDLLRIKYGNEHRLQDYVKLSKDQRFDKHFMRAVLQKVITDDFIQAFKDQTLFTDKPSAWQKVKAVVFSRSFGLTMTATTTLAAIKGGFLPFLPKGPQLRIEPQDVLTVLAFGSESPQARLVFDKYRTRYNTHAAYDIFRKTFNAAALGVLYFVAYEKSYSMLEAQRMQESQEAFSKFMGRYTTLVEQKPVTKADIALQETIKTFQQQYQRNPTAEEVEVLRSVVTEGM